MRSLLTDQNLDNNARKSFTIGSKNFLSSELTNQPVTRKTLQSSTSMKLNDSEQNIMGIKTLGAIPEEAKDNFFET